MSGGDSWLTLLCGGRFAAAGPDRWCRAPPILLVRRSAPGSAPRGACGDRAARRSPGTHVRASLSTVRVRFSCLKPSHSLRSHRWIRSAGTSRPRPAAVIDPPHLSGGIDEHVALVPVDVADERVEDEYPLGFHRPALRIARHLAFVWIPSRPRVLDPELQRALLLLQRPRHGGRNGVETQQTAQLVRGNLGETRVAQRLRERPRLPPRVLLLAVMRAEDRMTIADIKGGGPGTTEEALSDPARPQHNSRRRLARRHAPIMARASGRSSASDLGWRVRCVTRHTAGAPTGRLSPTIVRSRRPTARCRRPNRLGGESSQEGAASGAGRTPRLRSGCPDRSRRARVSVLGRTAGRSPPPGSGALCPPSWALPGAPANEHSE